MKERLLFVVFTTVIVISLYLGVFYTLTLSTAKISGHAVSTTQEEKLFKFQTNSDVLELREALGSVYPALTSKELPELLKSGRSTSNKGSTDYNQYLRFEDSNSLQKVMVNFTKEGSGVTDYLQIKSGSNISDAIFEYELEFEEGFQSDIKSARLEDIEDEELNILGRVFSVTSTSIDTSAKKVQLTLLSAPLVHILAEQETKKFTLDGKEYVVGVDVISDNEVNPEVRLKINDETTDTLEEGETYTLKDGTKLGIDDIIQSETSQDQVKIFLAAEKLYFEDTYDDETFSQGVKVNDGTISNAYIKIKATSTNSEFILSSIKYRVTSADDVYLPKSQFLSEEIKKESFLTGVWDIKYNGLSDVSTTEIKIDASGDTQLKLHFTNKKDKVYIFPFVNREGSGIFKLGDSTKSLSFIEGSNRTDFNINQQDYILLSNRNDRTGETHILRYNSIDTSSKTISFEDIAEGSKTVSYTENISGIQQGSATLDVGGTGYALFISNDSTPKLVIDQNADGNFNSGEAKIVVKGGGILDLGSTNNITDNFTVTLTTESNQFDERTSNEDISFTIEKRASTLGISSTFSGISLQSTDDHKYGMSDYGVLFDFIDESGTEADTLKIAYPNEQRIAEVFIISREIKTEASGEPVEIITQPKSEEASKPAVEEKPQAEQPAQPGPQKINPSLAKKEGSWSNYFIYIGIAAATVFAVLIILHLLKGRPKKPKTTSGQNYFSETITNAKDALSTFIQDHIKEGYTREQIKKYLNEMGYLEKQIEDAFSKLK